MIREGVREATMPHAPNQDRLRQYWLEARAIWDDFLAGKINIKEAFKANDKVNRKFQSELTGHRQV